MRFSGFAVLCTTGMFTRDSNRRQDKYGRQRCNVTGYVHSNDKQKEIDNSN